jgi:peptidoglycan L-alanyl-D-glutamate endopeptidase CwlK
MANTFELRYGKKNTAITTNNKSEINRDMSKTKFREFSKNVIKSSSNLTVDVIGSYLPNTKSFGESADEARKQAMAGIKTSFDRAKSTYKKILGITGGGESKDPKTVLKGMVKNTFDDTVSRVKKGQFYQSSGKNRVDSNFGFTDDFSEFDNFNTDFSDTDTTSTQYSDPKTRLSDEPFGESLTSVEKKVIKNRRSIPKKSNVVTTNNGSSQLTLGDKLVSDTTHFSATAIIDEQERLYNKQFAADEIRHVELMKYQNSINKSVASIAEHLQAVEGQGIARLIELQDKIVTLQNDTVSSINELKQAVVVTSPAYERDAEKYKSKYSKIVSGTNGLDFKEYGKNVKGNIMEMAYRSPIGMMLGLTPMLGSMLGMGEMGGLAGKNKFDPLSTLLRMGVNGFLTSQTRGRLSSLDDITSGIGPLFISQMNKMARFGSTNMTRNIGQVFGVKNQFAKKVNLGLEDMDAKLNWTAKSDRTLNVVIPGYLAKMTAALTGTEETFYDYSSGTFRKASSVAKEYGRTKQAAMYNTTISEYTTRMLDSRYQGKEAKGLINQYKKENVNITDASIKKDIDQIMENITKSGMHYSPEYIEDSNYRSQLLKQVSNNESLVIFDKLFHRLDAEEQLVLNRNLSERNVKYENAMLNFTNEVMKSGGGAALQNAVAEDEKNRLKYELQYSPHLQTKDGSGKEIPKNSQAYAMIKRRRQEVEKRIEALGSAGGAQISAVRVNADGTSDIGGLTGGQDSSSSMLGTLNNIFSLLSQGILVFPQKIRKGELPPHLHKIKTSSDSRREYLKLKEEEDQNEIERNNQSILQTEMELSDISRAQKHLMNARLRDIIGSVTGANAVKQFNPLNQLGAVVADTGIKGLGKAFNATGPEGPGLFGESQYERDITKFRQNDSSDAYSKSDKFVDPLKETALASLEKVKENMDKGGFIGNASKWLYPILEKKSKKQRNLGINSKSGIIKLKTPGGEEKQNRILAAVERAYDGFIKKFVFNKSSKVSEEHKQQFKTVLFTELKEEGIDSKEAINIVSQVIEEPLGENKIDPIIQAGEVSAITGVPVEIVVTEVGKSVTSSRLRNKLGDILHRDKTETRKEEAKEDVKEGFGQKVSSQVNGIFSKGGNLKQNITAFGNEKIGQFLHGIRQPKENSEPGSIEPSSSLFGGFGTTVKNKLSGLIMPPQEKIDEEKEAHKLAILSYNVLENTIQELVGQNKEPSFDDIEKAVNIKIKNGEIDKDIAHEVMRKAQIIGKDKDKAANPINSYYSAIYEMKESYNEKYRKDHSLVGNVLKRIRKGGIKGIAATTLLVTGHPIMAAMLAFGPKNTIKGGIGGIKVGLKGLMKGSKLLAGLSAKVLGTAAKMTPGIAKTGLGVVGRILGGDIFGEKPKKNKEELDQEKEIAALAFTALEGIHREIMETNPDATMGDIKKAVQAKVKSGAVDSEIADAIIKVAEQNYGDKDADATPLGSFLQAILTLKKQYSKQYRKETSVFRKIAMGILKGAGKGIGAAALLMAGHPILAAALALSGPAKLVKSIKNRFSKNSVNEKIPEANPIAQEKEATIQSSQQEVSEQAETAKEKLIKKLPGIVLGATSSAQEKVSKAKETVGNTFSSMKDKVSGFFSQERREGSYLDHKEDKKEEQQTKNQEEQTQILREIRDNTFDTEDELDDKEKRQKSLFSGIFKKLGIGAGAAAGGAGLAGVLGNALGVTQSGPGGGVKGVLNGFIGSLVNKGLGKGVATLASKGGAAGKIGGVLSKFVGGGKAASQVASVASKSTGILGKTAGLLGKAGGVGGKAVGALGKLGGVGGKAAGLLGKAGGLAKLAGPALGGIAKFAGPVGIALAAAQAVGGGVKGWKNAANIAGLEEGKDATTGQKVGSAVSGGLSALTLGLLKPEMIYGAGKKIGNVFKNAFNKGKYELNEDGTPKLDENGKPILIKKPKDLSANILKAGTLGLTDKGIKSLNKLPIKSSQELLQDIQNLLSQGILVFPSTLNPENAPAHLKDMAKSGKYTNVSPINEMSSVGSMKKESLFDKGRNFISNLFNGQKNTGGGNTYTPTHYTQSSTPGNHNNQTNASYIANSNSRQTYNSGSQGTSQEFSFDVNKIKGPDEASSFFYNNANLVSNELENKLYDGDYGEIEKLADKIKDPSSMAQNRSPDSLSPEFGERVKNFLNSPEAQAMGVKVREARRSPLTQLAYFTKGRASDTGFINEMFKKAGFANGAWDPHVQNTQTIGSKHFTGEAIDLEDNGKGESFYKEISPIAKKYGLSWGGDWQGWKDPPHFEMPRNDSDIGYSGPPKESNTLPDIASQRADGYGTRYGTGKGINRFNKATGFNKNLTTSSMKRYNQNDYMGTSTLTSLHLNESPLITSDKELITQINNAINIQNAIHSEQRRHNSVSENFFTSLISLLTEMSKATNNSQRNISGGNNDMSNLSAILKAEQVAKEYFSSTARAMATGY